MSRNRNNSRRGSNGGQFRPQAQPQPPAQDDAPQQEMAYEIRLDTPSDQTLANVLYKQDRGHLHLYFGEKFGVQLDPGGPSETALKFSGTPDAASRAKRAFAMMSGMVQGGAHIDKSAVSSIASQINPPRATAAFMAANQNKKGGGNGGSFTPKNEGQAELAELIDNNDCVLAVGPAGTGKTHVAVIKAVTALKEGKVKKILLARPAAESGEKLGFLPGDANAKMGPYMRPIFDELDKAFGPGRYKQMMEQGVIEICPISYMRGRTFEDAFVILDEAQNTTKETAKMALSRVGNNSKIVVTGDLNQVDLPKPEQSGLRYLLYILKDAEGVGVKFFDEKEVVRSKFAQTFVTAAQNREPGYDPSAPITSYYPNAPKALDQIVEDDKPLPQLPFEKKPLTPPKL